MVQEERLYSTGDEMLDNLLERAFCEGYELAQREFGFRDIKKARAIARQVQGAEEEKKIKWLDKRNIEALKKFYNKDKELRDINLKQVDEDPETRKEGNEQYLRKRTKQAVKGAIAGSVAGGGLSYGLSRLFLGADRKESAKLASRSLRAGAIGSLIMVGEDRLISKLGNKVREKNLIEGKERALKHRDTVRVAAGQMSEEEFAEKWGKKSKKK